jgi:hypothetical protein
MAAQGVLRDRAQADANKAAAAARDADLRPILEAMRRHEEKISRRLHGRRGMEKPSFAGRLLPSDFISESPTRSRGDRDRGKVPGWVKFLAAGLLNLEPSLHPLHT